MTKPVMVLRNVKAAALTHTEHDQNFINLRDATISLRAGTGGTAVTSDLNGSITLVAGTNVTLSGDNTAKTITINAANESQNIFQNIAVAGQSTVSADTTSDTLTLVAGSNITLTTNASTDTITIASTGGLTDIVNDTTPQLGGNLDVNGRSIVSVSNGNIVLAPNGTGMVVVNGITTIKGTSLNTLILGDSTVSTSAKIGIAAGVTSFSISDGVNNISFNEATGTGGIRLDTDPGRNIVLSAGTSDTVELDGAVKIKATSGTPTTFENGYYEDMLQTPVSWLRITVGSSVYYLPLFQ